MKIIGMDNFNTETVSDILIADSIQHEAIGQCMTDALNAKFSGDQAPRFYVLKPDDYQLYKWEP